MIIKIKKVLKKHLKSLRFLFRAHFGHLSMIDALLYPRKQIPKLKSSIFHIFPNMYIHTWTSIIFRNSFRPDLTLAVFQYIYSTYGEYTTTINIIIPKIWQEGIQRYILFSLMYSIYWTFRRFFGIWA